MEDILTADVARTLVAIDPLTGLITRTKRTSNSVRVGEIAGTVHSVKGYVYLYVNGKNYTGHRIAWLLYYGEWPAGQVDHINGDRSDNRLANLRVVDGATNSENRRGPQPANTSGLLGVSWMAGAKKWRAQICVKKKVVYLGLFADKDEAHKAYLSAKRSLHMGCTI